MLFGVLCFCGVVLYNYQPRDMERMVVEMMCCQDIENEVVDFIRNGGERVVGCDVDTVGDCFVVVYECRGVEFYCYCFGTVVFVNRVAE